MLLCVFLYYTGADFGKDYPYSFSMNLGTTSNNNADSLLTPEYGQNQLLNPTHPYSPQLLQNAMTTQSTSTSLDMSNSVPATNKDTINYSMQQDSQTNIGKEIHTSLYSYPYVINVCTCMSQLICTLKAIDDLV